MARHPSNKLNQVRMYQLRANMLERIAKELNENDTDDGRPYLGRDPKTNKIVNRALDYIDRIASLTTIKEACMIWRDMSWDAESCARQLNALFGWQIPEHVRGMAVVRILTEEECNSFDT